MPPVEQVSDSPPRSAKQKYRCGCAISRESREEIILMEMIEHCGVSPSCKINCCLITRNGAVIFFFSFSFFQRSEDSTCIADKGMESVALVARIQITSTEWSSLSVKRLI